MLQAGGPQESTYQEYRHEIEGERMTRSLRAGCVVVSLLSAAFVPLDFTIFRQNFVAMLAFRLFCNAVMLVIIFRTARTHPLESAIVGCLTTGAMLLIVIGAAGGLTSDYTPGLMLLFLGMPVLLPFTARQAGTIVAILTGALASLPLLSGTPIGLELYSLNLIFPLAAGVESVAACALLEKMRFADFLRRREIEQTRDDLKALDREKSRFTANIHHELRTPLTLMLAPVDALLAGDFGEIDELPHSYLETIRSNGLRLLNLINNLLDLAKIESQSHPINRQLVLTQGVIENLLKGAQPLAEQKNVLIETSGIEDLPQIFVDPDSFEKIVMNLISNALKFTNHGGHIEIKGEATAEGGIIFAFTDDGIGLAENQIERIFDRFAQVDTSQTKRYEGTGIGLSLVRELVEMHGGQVWAESRGLGYGTTMRVTFPRGALDCDGTGKVDDIEGDWVKPDLTVENERGSDSRESALCDRSLAFLEIQRNIDRTEYLNSTKSPELIQNAAPSHSRRILIVDDNNDMRRFLAFLIGREFRVELARDGLEGIDKARTDPPDLILTDVMMPGLPGTELCREIKDDPRLRHIPVVLLTSKAEREMKIQGLELGADDYVTKPFHPREIMARIRSLIRLRSLQEEVEIKNVRLSKTNAELARTVSELKEAGSALVQAERLAAVGELAAGIAHEVNNPVNFATNALRTLKAYVEDVCSVVQKVQDIDWSDGGGAQEKVLDLEELKKDLRFGDIANSLSELVAIVTEGLDRTHRLVSDLRDFATPGRGEITSIDIGKGLQSTLQLIRYTVREKNVIVTPELRSDLPEIKGDARALNQVFLNLLKNACESIGEAGGNIWVTTDFVDDGVAVRIRDDGSGIGEEDLDQLFEPFFSTKASGRGTGLGLSISHRIVSEHGGRITVTSELGVGSTFVVWLPSARSS